MSNKFKCRYIESILIFGGGSILGTSCQYMPIAICCILNKYCLSITTVKGNSGSVLDSSKSNFGLIPALLEESAILGFENI